jgi:MYXO-CTERM domain-containing protein
MKALLRTSIATLVGSVALLVASAAFAAGEPCFNDTDCPGGGAVCGGDVCKWGPMHASPVGDKVYICQAAGMDPKGSDGWCTAENGHDNCKCKALGAKCVGVYCTFTKPDQAPPGAGGGAGGAGAGGSAAGTTSTAGTSAAGTSATGGTGSKPPAAEESGGCSVASPASTSGGIALALGLIGVGAAFARRRRS